MRPVYWLLLAMVAFATGYLGWIALAALGVVPR